MFTGLQNLISDPEKQQDLFGELYREMKGIARAKMARERPGSTLSPTALVHEAWLRLQKGAKTPWRDKAHFFAAASEAMRRILVEAARRRNAVKRGGGEEPIPLEGLDLPDNADPHRLLEVNEVLDALEADDPFKAQVVKLKFYCGMENAEIASALGVNEKTVRRHWQVAKVRLFQAIQEGQ